MYRATALAALAPIALAAACARPAERESPFAKGVMALRAAVVGDVGRHAPIAAIASPSVRSVRAPSRTTEPADSAWGDPADWPTDVIHFTSTAAAPLTAWTGDTIALVAPVAPSGTPPSIERDLRWKSDEARVASVDRTGRVVAVSPGTTRITAWRRVGEATTDVTVLPAIRGRVAAADATPVRARVIAQAGRWSDSTITAPDGWFAMRFAAAPDGPVSLRIEPLDDAHAPAALTSASLDRLADVDVVLLPRRWRIDGGAYAGESVPIRPSIALGRARDGLRLWSRTRPGAAGLEDGRVVGWDPARLPLPVAFDRAARVSATDSAAFWSAVTRLERDWGRPLFRPATLGAGDAGFGGVTVTVDARLGTEGLTTTGWNGDGDLYDAEVAFRTRAALTDPAIVTHEMLHALGIGHAGGELSSVMHPIATALARASAEDVAYAQLLYAVRSRGRGARTTVGVAAAAAAEDR